MKISVKIGSWLTTLLMIVSFSSCIEDNRFPSVSAEDGVPVAIELDAESVLTTVEGDEADREISSLRVLMYQSVGGSLAFNIPITVPTPSVINILTGTYDFVFIANEDSDPALKAHLTSAGNADINTLAKLRALKFDRMAFDASKDIPMVKMIEQVRVLGDNTYRILSNSLTQTGIWSVPMQRAAIRLQLLITMTEAQYLEWSTSPNITISNIAGEAFVLPEIDNSASQSETGETFAAGTTANALPGFISASDGSGKRTVTYNRLILPELFLSPSNNIEDNGMLLSMKFGSKTKSGMVKVEDDDPLGYALPRNHFLKLNATVKEDAINIDAEVLPWGDAEEDILFDGQYTLVVEEAEFHFAAAGNPQPIHVTTDYPLGWSITTTDTWIKVPTQADNTVGVDPNTSNAIRSGTFKIVAGNLRKIIRVIQYPAVANITDSRPSYFTPYVGAFWRSDQQGERLIRMTGSAAYGKWTAVVIEGEEWIHLDTQMTSDMNVGWRTDDTPTESAVKSGNDSDFESNYYVSGNMKHVSGVMDANNPIYFRIGLNSTYSPDSVRYGVVLLVYKDSQYMQRIWIRQGEAPDYLMRDADPINALGLTVRTETVPFSPYNLTAKTLNAPVSRNGSTDSGEQPAIFTDYPSQVGALWQWASVVNPRYAWDPYNSTVQGYGANDYNQTAFWNVLGADHETCPPGYRRPTNGPIDRGTDAPFQQVNAEFCEIMQSLYEIPDLGYSPFANNKTNFSDGYYADGFFDRRAIQPYDVTGAIEAVSISNRYVANMGGVFFNEATKASLFFAKIGYRDGNTSTGILRSSSDEHYWTSTTAGAGVSPAGAGWAYRGYPLKASALAIRCVKAAPL